MDTEVMLTTFDNPYDPFDDFVSWWLFDIQMGYNTCGLIARTSRYSEDFSVAEEKAETERAIDEIIKYDDFNIYKRLTREATNEEV